MSVCLSVCPFGGRCGQFIAGDVVRSGRRRRASDAGRRHDRHTMNRHSAGAQGTALGSAQYSYAQNTVLCVVLFLYDAEHGIACAQTREHGLAVAQRTEHSTGHGTGHRTGHGIEHGGGGTEYSTRHGTAQDTSQSATFH